MKNMKKLIWKCKYARHIKRKLGLTVREALGSAEAALEMIDYDLSEDPIHMADEEISCWIADC